jgi:hypothetical protein
MNEELNLDVCGFYLLKLYFLKATVQVEQLSGVP